MTGRRRRSARWRMGLRSSRPRGPTGDRKRGQSCQEIDFSTSRETARVPQTSRCTSKKRAPRDPDDQMEAVISWMPCDLMRRRTGRVWWTRMRTSLSILMTRMVEKRSGVMGDLGESPQFGLKCLWPRRAGVKVVLVLRRRRRSRERHEMREREKPSEPRVPSQRRLLPPLPPRSPPRHPPLSSFPWTHGSQNSSR